MNSSVLSEHKKQIIKFFVMSIPGYEKFELSAENVLIRPFEMSIILCISNCILNLFFHIMQNEAFSHSKFNKNGKKVEFHKHRVSHM